ncbi:uncharacterized protein LOC131693035 isoform X2 [Topomyia yanbarensis]|uniref:uncharacterized protein LOC131693035 isoform X2 n=1 Tax=Topomyia yanbarensis TaxID=2498891 RepID=UPI00273C3AFC|nr:uncharacterized protein LOC131693035 isoform X2 [Topomyia yanbarensis]
MKGFVFGLRLFVKLNHGLLLVLLVLVQVEGLPKVFRSNEICGVYNGHRVYLELGDRGQLQATNVTVAKHLNRTASTVCTLELVTCPSCNLKISLSYSNFPTKCSIRNELPCRCDYLEFSEPPFEEDQSRRRNCGNDVIYQSQTRSVLIKFIHWNNHTHAFTLEYVAERNRESLQGDPGQYYNLTGMHSRIITTPYFPSYYPRDFGKEYVLNCNVDACRINIIFSDFQLAKTSTMEFYDWNGQRLGAVSGVSFRPPVVQSTGPSMIVRFFANGGSGLGYRAKVSFLTEESASEPSVLPDTNCGGMVENIGGAITMMNMVPSDNDSKIFDCIWLVKPPNTYAHLKTHLSLKINTLEKIGPNSMLTMIQGTTSNNAVMDVVRSSMQGNGRNYVVPLTTGFYIHLRGTFTIYTRMALVYAAFSYLDCYMGSEYLCQNRKCIPIQLHCDGFDHCGDGSDEPESCEAQWESDVVDRRWYSHTPNYYFPKMDRYPDLRTATTIFIASSLGLIVLISTLVILLYRSGNRARQQRELQSQLQTISDLLVDNNSRGAEELDDPPMYEAPPDYDEIIKVGMDDDVKRKRRRHSSSSSGRRSRMRRARRPSNVSDSNNPILEVWLPPESNDIPSTSGTLHVPYGGDNQRSLDLEDDISYDSHWNHQESNAFMSTRVIEAAASCSTGQNLINGTATSSSATNVPPAYDESLFYRNRISSAKIVSHSTSTSDDSMPRGCSEEAPNVTPSPKEASEQSTSRIPPPTERSNSNNTRSSTSFDATEKPQHIWSENTRRQRLWLTFGSDEFQFPAASTSYCEALDSIDFSRVRAIDAYLLACESASNNKQSSPEDNSQNKMGVTGCPPISSTSSVLKNLQTDSSTSIASNGQGYTAKNCHCCKEKLSLQDSLCQNCTSVRQTSIPAVICSTCGGKISLQESLNLSREANQQTTTGGSDGEVPLPSGPTVKLCNCFPQFGSPNKILRAGSANYIPDRACSIDLIETGYARRSVANLASSFEAFFNSHITARKPDI